MPKRVKDEYADLIYKIEPAPPKDTSAEKKQIEQYVEKHTIACKKMVGRVSRSYCIERQQPKAAYRSAYAPRYKEDPFEAYCRSGKCVEGQTCLRELEQWDTGTNSPDTLPTTTRRSRKSRRPSSRGSRKSSNPQE